MANKKERMRNALLFVAIMTICGSVMKAPVYRMCQTELSIKYYLKGKLIFKANREEHRTSFEERNYRDYTGKTFDADSMVIEPRFTSYRMVDK